MSKLNKVLGVCVSCLCLTAVNSALADYVSLVHVTNSDGATVDLCNDFNGEFVTESLAVCTVLAQFDDPTDKLANVGNADIVTSDTEGYFQHIFGNGLISPACSLLGVFPDLICDSFVTIGVRCNDGNDSTSTDPDFDPVEFNDNGHVVGGWYNGNPFGTQGTAGEDPPNQNLQVLFLQLAVRTGNSITGQIDLFVNIGGETFAEVDQIIECFAGGGCQDAGDCDDENPCTDDDCVDTVCVNTDAKDGTACDDGVFCNGTETCTAGACGSSTGDPCDGPDGDDNCAESCDEATADCTASDPDNSACDNGLFCDGTETCGGGVCGNSTGDPCTGGGECSSACSEDADNCFDADGANCGDGATECSGQDTCDGAGTCQDNHESDGTNCGDGATQCSGQDTCDGDGACQNNDVADDTPCDDGQACNVGEACQSGSCTGGGGQDCSGSSDQCNDASCDSGGAEGNCDTLTPVDDGTGCDDGDNCTDGDVCTGGACSGEEFCESGEVCVEGVCENVECPEGDACDDDDACTSGTTCDAIGNCTGGTPTDCSGAGDQCNDASCDSGGANGNCDILTPVKNGTSCDDGDNCTDGDVCASGSCSGESFCEPGDDCVDGVCIPVECPEGEACNDGDACTEGSICNADEECVGGTPIECPEDDNECTQAVCDSETGCGQAPAEGSCDDEDACTEGDSCSDGECSGEPIDCPGGTICVDGECVEGGELPLDIKPRMCPNTVMRDSNAAVWAALLGSEDFDITQVRMSTLLLSRADGLGGSLAPKNLRFKDEGTPFEGDLCDCHSVGRDQITDLRMKFKTEAMVEVFLLNDESSGESIELIVTGQLNDGTLIFGRDCILLTR